MKVYGGVLHRCCSRGKQINVAFINVHSFCNAFLTKGSSDISMRSATRMTYTNYAAGVGEHQNRRVQWQGKI
jgi:hypothetical protein